MKNAVLSGKTYAGNPYVRFDEEEIASAKPRRGSLYKKTTWAIIMAALMASVVGAEEAYLESNGTQYVPINYRANARTKIVVDYQYTNPGASQAVFGSWGDANGPGSGTCVGFWSNASSNPEGTINGNWTGRLKVVPGTNNNGTDTLRYRLTADVPNFRFTLETDGETIVKTCERTELAEDTLFLGIFADTVACGSADDTSLLATPAAITAVRMAKLRIYSFKIYEGEELLFDLVPARKGDVSGFYDRQSEAFYGSVTGPLASGGDVLELEDDPYVSAPEGGVSIDTGYTMTPETRLEIDYAIMARNGAAQQFVFESGSASASDLMTRIYVNGSNGYSWTFSDTYNYTVFVDNAQVQVSPGTRRQVALDSVAGTVCMTTYGITNAWRAMETSRTCDSKSTLHLLSNAAGNNNYANGRIYGLKIFESDVLKHDFRPMKSFGEGILKDVVTGRVLWSLTSTPLAFGGLVAEEPYVESLGGAEIGLDYVPNSNTCIEVDYQIMEKGGNNVVFGANIYDTTGFGMQQNSGMNQEFRCHGAWSGGAAGNADLKRHTAVIDNPASKAYYRTAGVNKTTIDMSGKGNYVDPAPTCTTNLSIFGDTVYTTSTKPSKARIFFVTIWENGEIVHRYEPFIRNGEIGFRDLVTDRFFGRSSRSPVDRLVCGGVIAQNGPADAYIASDGTQVLSTGYVPTSLTRIELDFESRAETKSDQFFFGRWDNPCWVLHVNYLKKFTYGAHINTNMRPQVMDADCQRHKAIFDRKNAKFYLTRPDGSVLTNSMPAVMGVQSDVPLALFARMDSSMQNGYFGGVAARIYSFRVYEDDALAHEYLPFKDGDFVGLRDTVTGGVLTNIVAGTAALEIGGMGVDGGAPVFVVAPQDGQIGPRGTVALSAFAPGAVAYRWTRDGVEIPNETRPVLTATWQEGLPQCVYSVTPIYSVCGIVREGTPVEATVTNLPRGLMVIVR